MTRTEAISFLLNRPADFGRMLGFSKLTGLHNKWIVDMVQGRKDETLQGHRGSYKTTCLSIALAVIIILFPQDKTLFMRKTDDDVKEIIKQTKNILRDKRTIYLVSVIYGIELKLTVDNATEISTNLTADIKGTPQVSGMGIGSSITGKHFDRIFTDDIVNKKDRASRAERERTKAAYYELHNIKNRGGRIFNTGTPWHKDDCFSIMPPPAKFDCYSTGLISAEELQELKDSMLTSLFAANYELRHIGEDDVIFTTPQTGADITLIRDGIAHIDAAYGGADFTAFSAGIKKDGKYYLYGRLWQKHVDDCEEEIKKIYAEIMASKLFTEDNGDKGYLAKSLKRQGVRAVTYHEDTNKYIKITTYLKAAWKDVVFVAGTDEEYINQICDYNENAEHDDAPDSAACIIRRLWGKKDSGDDYKPLYN